MCLVLFSYKSHPDYPLILASNRDEFYERPAAPATFWKDAPDLLAGRDLKSCGTWLGITKTGKIAIVTNFRDPYAVKDDATSRGELVINSLRSRDDPTEYIRKVNQKADEYNGFNLLFGYMSDLYYFSNRGGTLQKISPGLYGLINHLPNYLDHSLRQIAGFLIVKRLDNLAAFMINSVKDKLTAGAVL